MKTLADIKRYANDIIEVANEYPAEARYEVLDELVEVTRRDEGLTTQEIQRLVSVLNERGTW